MKYILDFLYILVLVLVCTFYTFNKITYNWDFIGYIGVVNGYTESNAKKAHEKTYSYLSKSIDVEKYELNVEGYRKVMSEDYKAFEENLSFYKIRPLYTCLIFVFSKIGFSLLYSIKLMAFFPNVIFLLLVYFTVRKVTNNNFLALLFALCLIFSLLISKMATTTPDALSAMLLLMLSLAYYFQKNNYLQFVIMFLLVATRTDNFLWVTLLLIIDTVSMLSIKKVKFNLLVFILLFIMYNLINSFAGNSGVWIVYYNTLVNRLNYPLTETPSFNIKDYCIGQIFALKYTVFTLFVTFIIAFWGYINFKYHKSILSTNIVFATVFSLIFRLVLFPAYNSRYMLILFFIPTFILLIDNKYVILRKLKKIHNRF